MNNLQNIAMIGQKHIILSVVILTFITAHAQSVGLAYGYDAAGNRISRIVVNEPSLPSPRYDAPTSHQQGDVTVSPTVTTGTVTISTTADITQHEYSWVLSDVQGRIVATGSLGFQISDISISGAAGMYILTVTGNDERHCFKIVKQ